MRSQFRWVLTTLLLMAGATSVVATPASANAPINEFSVQPSITQAGGHPDVQTFVWVGNNATQNIPPPTCNCHDSRDLNFNYPAGLIGSPQNVPQCSQADFANLHCAIDTQVGVNLVGLFLDLPKAPNNLPIPVFNLTPHPGQAGLLGFNAPIVESPIYIIFEPRTESDYGLNPVVSNIPHLFGNALTYTELTLWGVPADHSHDPLRMQPVGCNSQLTGDPPCEGGAVSNAPLAPFISNPTTCGEPLLSSVLVMAYDKGTDTAQSSWPATTGCDQLSFNPSLFAQPTTNEADTASGVDIDLKVPQQLSPTAPSPSEIRATSVTLPEGFSINPSAADGKSSCSEGQANVGIREKAAECPEFSKVGSLKITSASLPGILPGYVYLRDPAPGTPYRIWLVANGFGVHVKLPGTVHADPVTGRLTTTFENLPQFPFSDFNMHFFGSERSLLATPKRCGTYPVESTFTPWDAALAEQTSTQFFSLTSGPDGSPCPGATRPFGPTLLSGVADKGAGQHSAFTLDVSRADGDQNLSGITVATPPGFAATLKGVPYCPEAAIAKLLQPGYSGRTEQAAPACPAGSQIGTAIAGAGAGSHPLYLDGSVYLAGPYKKAPLSLMVAIPAVSGPYDLGVVAVRSAVRVDPRTAQITTVSDPLPQILEGLPVRTRSIRISLDREHFTVNPTNCDPFAVQSSILGDEGAAAALSARFQVANCSALGFRPRLSLQLRGSTKRRGHPGLHAVLSNAPGEANIARTVVAMPSTLILDNSHIGSVCTRVAFASNTCPAASIIGSARAETPLLEQPLAGKVYLRSNPSGRLPDVVVDLEGQIEIELVGKISSSHGGLRTTFTSVPDAPVTQFDLDLEGGAKGLLISTESLCKRPQRANIRINGQNGKQVRQSPKLKTGCGSGKARP